jgi:2',3'-cyclic-nucleotide 2'-phosphodiesterase (5'-nucleotidase family)
MNHLPRALLAVLAFAALTTGCVDYNEPCKGFTENPDEVIGYLGEEVYLAKPNARHANNAIGQLAADAFKNAPNNSGEDTVLGIINGGGIRAEGLCATRNILPKGSLTSGRLHEIMLFNDIVESLDLTGAELTHVMEVAVQGLYAHGENIASPSGNFLQLSEGAHLTVDCTPPAAPRVTAFTINGVDVLASPDTPFRVGLTNFLLESEDGFEDLRTADQDPSRNPAQANESGGIDSNITAEYMKANHPEQNPLAVDPSRVVWTKDVNGVDTCATPGRPTPN